jgi:hypothetical protein
VKASAADGAKTQNAYASATRIAARMRKFLLKLLIVPWIKGGVSNHRLFGPRTPVKKGQSRSLLKHSTDDSSKSVAWSSLSPARGCCEHCRLPRVQDRPSACVDADAENVDIW